MYQVLEFKVRRNTVSIQKSSNRRLKWFLPYENFFVFQLTKKAAKWRKRLRCILEIPLTFSYFAKNPIGPAETFSEKKLLKVGRKVERFFESLSLFNLQQFQMSSPSKIVLIEKSH